MTADSRSAAASTATPRSSSSSSWRSPSASDAVLDVGCGVGSMTFALGPLVASVRAVDDRPDAIDEARRLTAEIGLDQRRVRPRRPLRAALSRRRRSTSSSAATPSIASPSRSPPCARCRACSAPRAASSSTTPSSTADDDRYLNELAKLADTTHRRHCRRDEFLPQFAQGRSRGRRRARRPAHRRPRLLARGDGGRRGSCRTDPHAPPGAADQGPDGDRPRRRRPSGVVLVRRRLLQARARLIDAVRRCRRRSCAPPGAAPAADGAGFLRPADRLARHSTRLHLAHPLPLPA